MIQFKATVVTNRTTFWTDVTSTRMTANQAGGGWYSNLLTLSSSN
ncbi:hypothetical protein FSP39_002310 [Pinctada imbricata]|uniref:Uncharacterized protein n=1 Tax=Pinctada imbricata TaxID=66713 RepID=A0AA89C7R7_PINIB|nr:hypothetical protein FSP39_002310 [Pinctada imbricata]